MKTSLLLLDAQRIAEQVVAWLQPACERIEVAGSIRRRKAQVGDIEIVAIPKPVVDLFGEPTGETEVDWLMRELGSAVTKNGPKYKQWMKPLKNDDEVQIDLFLADADNFGYILMLRTGPWQFSQRMVTLRTQGGLRPPELQCRNGYVWTTDGYVLPLQTEDLLFSAWGMDYMPPQKRS